MIISNTLTALIKFQNKFSEKKVAFKYKSKNNFSETDLNEFIELIYDKNKLLNESNDSKLSITLFAGEHLLFSSSNNINIDDHLWQYPNFTEILVNHELYLVNKNGYAIFFKERIFTLNRQIIENRIFKTKYMINTNNFLTVKKDRRNIVYNNSYNGKGFLDKLTITNSKQKAIIYNRNGKSN